MYATFKALKTPYKLLIGLVTFIILINIFTMAYIIAKNRNSVRVSYAANSVEIGPVADTHVKSAYPDKNYGKTSVLITANNSSNIQLSFLKFDLTQLAGKTITSASLTIKPSVSRKVEKNIKLVTDNWTETGMTWNNKPSMGGVVGTLPLQNVTSGIPITISLDPAAVQRYAGSTFSIGIDNTRSTNIIKYYSRQASSANKPFLTVSVSGSTASNPPPFELVPDVPPFSTNKLTPRVLVLAWGDHPNPDLYETNVEIITRLERELEWASMPGGWYDPWGGPPPSGVKALVDLQLPYGTDGIVQFAADQPPKSGGSPDYVTIMNTTYSQLNGNSPCQLVNSGNVDEVWLLGYNSAGFYSSVMAGPASSNNTPENNKAFRTNNNAVITGTNCNKGVHIMGLSNEDVNENRPTVFSVNERYPSLDSHLTAFALRFQSTYAHYLDNNQNYAYPPNFGPDPDGQTDFIEFDRTFGYSDPPGLWDENPSGRSCGNALYPHNSIWLGGREYYNKQNVFPGGSFDVTVRTDCTNTAGNWNVQHTGTKEDLDCSAWNCWAEKYLIRWMQHFPGYCNGLTKLDGSAMPNWWEMMYLNTVSSDSCAPVSTPTPLPTNTPAPGTCPTGYICATSISCAVGFHSESSGSCGGVKYCLTCVPN